MFFFDPDLTRALITSKFKYNRLNVMSHEVFLGSPHCAGFNGYDNFLKIKSLFPNAKILICIREQTDMILSSYKQYIKNLGILS